MTISDRKLTANRINATKPRRHSRRKSFLIGAILLPHESSSRFASLFDSFTAEYNPQDHIERILVEKMTVAHWRLLRIWSLETAGIALEVTRQRDAHPTENPPDHTLRALHALSDTHRHSDILGRHERRYEREFYNALRALKQHRKTENKKMPPIATELNESKEQAPGEVPPVATDSHQLATPEPPPAK